jgi:hypothetical protein
VNEEPKPHQPDQFSFEKEPTPATTSEPEAPAAAPTPAEPVRSAIYPTPGEHSRQAAAAAAASTVKLDRTSGVAMYMLAVVSGLITVSGASYLISDVLRYFFVEKNNMLLYFDLSSITLYFLVVTLLFGVVHFLTMALVQKGSSSVGLGFRRRHEAVSAVWQTLLALFILGSIVTFIHSPLDHAINGASSMTEPSERNGELTATMLSATFVLLFAGILLWRDRMVAKGNNALIPTAVGALLLVAVVGASIVTMSIPKEKPKTPDYESMYGGSSSTSDFNFEASTEDDSSSSSGSWSFDSESSSSDSTSSQQP